MDLVCSDQYSASSLVVVESIILVHHYCRRRYACCILRQKGRHVMYCGQSTKSNTVLCRSRVISAASYQYYLMLLVLIHSFAPMLQPLGFEIESTILDRKSPPRVCHLADNQEAPFQKTRALKLDLMRYSKIARNSVC